VLWNSPLYNKKYIYEEVIVDGTGPFEGTWTYRSFISNPDLTVNVNELLFGAGTLELSEPSFGTLAGTLGGPGWSLALSGAISYGNPFTARFQGAGDINGETWVYDYTGYLVPPWPNGVDQRPAIVGSVIRTVPHSGGQAAAGFVASFIAVRQGD
jgi:hypothetical protein